MERSPVGRLVAALCFLATAASCSDSPAGPSLPVLNPVAIRIDSVTPSVGSTEAQTTVVIQGDGFAAGATVTVGAVVLTPSETAPSSLIVTVPPQPPAVVTVTVRNPDGRSARLDDGFRFEVKPPTDPNFLRVTGQLLAGGSGLPFAGASMRVLQDVDPARPPVTTDDDGRFTLVGIVPAEVEEVQILVDRSGMLWKANAPWTLTVPRGAMNDVVLQVPDLLLIRPGRSLRGALAGLGQGVPCTFESIPCLPVVVDGPPGTSIELELIPDSGELGLVLEEEFLAPTSFQTRLVVSPRSLWIMGCCGSFRLIARSVGETGK